MGSRDSDKGIRYIAALDNARCHGKWDEVPELIRKVTKHASQMTCFLETASADLQIAAHIRQRSSAQSPLLELIPPLLSAINKESIPHQHKLQAQASLGWVHWMLGEPRVAADRLPSNFAEVIDTFLHNGQELSPWTEACIVKGCYIKGYAQSLATGPSDALVTFSTIFPWLESHIQKIQSNPDLSNWSEKLLAKAASLAGEEVSRGTNLHDNARVENSLRIFRLWFAHPRVKQWVLSSGSEAESASDPVSKTAMFRSYYDLLTAIVQQDLPYVTPLSGLGRPQLASEIRRVQSICENNLLREVRFPMASANSPQVEAWVELVIRNWEVLCGPNWQGEDLGEGGQAAVSRAVLDILYRSSAKTYHSPLILKRLFHVHSALAEFDLAIRALDSYVEIVTKAKERAEKWAEHGELESDSTLLQTVSQGVVILCCFGSYTEAEKARELVALLKEFTKTHTRGGTTEHESDKLPTAQSSSLTSTGDVSPSTLATTFRAIGIGLANWASWTRENDDRDNIRSEAIEYLEKSLAPELADEMNFSSLYTLGLLLAENRDLDGAIECVRLALTSNAHITVAHAEISRKLDLVPVWHLLALLLSAKQDFEAAERSCQVAFEQFLSAVTLPDQRDGLSPSQAQDEKDQYGVTSASHAPIGYLGEREKERAIEARITQLTFIELSEGAEAAVNCSDQLLGLFATLFPDLRVDDGKGKGVRAERAPEPKSSAGSIRSFRGSVFGRNRAPRGQDRKIEANTALASQALNGDGGLDGEHQKQQERRSSAKRPKSAQSENPQPASTMAETPPAIAKVNSQQTSKVTMPQEMGATAASQAGVGAAASLSRGAKQHLPPTAYKMKHTHHPMAAGQVTQLPGQDVLLPACYRFSSPTNALIQFPARQLRRHALCILIKIWLLISGLYRRALLLDDALEACAEASKHAAEVETLVATEDSSARAFRSRGWGFGKSCDELWADIYTERGLLSKAQSRPHEAMEHFEAALVLYSNHPKATINLASLLLDIWDKKLPLDPPQEEIEFGISKLSLLGNTLSRNRATGMQDHNSKDSTDASADNTKRYNKEELATSSEAEPRFLSRLAARERAYGLLSILTKRGSSWDNSEAWFTLSRVYEAEGQTKKLREVLWWCIELEDRRPIRHWSNIGPGLYVL